MDAAAAVGIIERKGLAKVRHIDVDVLWLQETLARQKLPLRKVPGVDNMSDLMTKNVDVTTAEHHARIIVLSRPNH